MAETLGSLCDKLTIVKLKQFHCEDYDKSIVLAKQNTQLINEVNEYIYLAFNGNIPLEKLSFKSNKIYNKNGNQTSVIEGEIGEIFSKLADFNCKLWHEQEKVFEFEKVPIEEKDKVVKNLAILNLERTNCIDKIDNLLISLIEKNNKNV
jgi:hypothetical protein